MYQRNVTDLSEDVRAHSFLPFPASWHVPQLPSPELTCSLACAAQALSSLGAPCVSRAPSAAPTSGSAHFCHCKEKQKNCKITNYSWVFIFFITFIVYIFNVCIYHIRWMRTIRWLRQVVNMWCVKQELHTTFLLEELKEIHHLGWHSVIGTIIFRQILNKQSVKF